MTRGYQIDIGSMLIILQLKKDLAQTLRGDFRTRAMRKLIVLTIQAVKRTERKEDSATAAIPHKTRLFPPMKRRSSQLQGCRSTANARFSFKSVDATMTRTQMTRCVERIHIKFTSNIGVLHMRDTNRCIICTSSPCHGRHQSHNLRTIRSHHRSYNHHRSRLHDHGCDRGCGHARDRDHGHDRAHTSPLHDSNQD